MSKEIGDQNRERFAQLGAAIAAARKRKGLSQQHLTERAHISPAYLNVIETAGMARSFSLKTLYLLADALEMRAGELLNTQFPK